MARRERPIAHNPHLGNLEQCIQNNSRLVHKVCQRFAAKVNALGIDYEDIASVGTIGLMKSYERFDPTSFFGNEGQPVKFSTYAVPMIIGEIRRFLRDYNGGAKFSRSAKEIGARIIHVFDEHGADSMPAEKISNILNVSMEKVKAGLAWLRNQSADSLSTAVFENDGDPITIEDQIPVHDDQSSTFVNDFLNQIPERYRTVVEGRMEGKTQHEIAHELGISQVQVSRLQTKIGKLLKRYMNGQKMKFNKGEIEAMGARKIDEGKIKWLFENGVPRDDIIAALNISAASFWNYKAKFKKGELTCESDPTAADLISKNKKGSAKPEQSPQAEVATKREINLNPEALKATQAFKGEAGVKPSATEISVSMTAGYVIIEEAVRYALLHLDQSKKYTFQISVQEAV